MSGAEVKRLPAERLAVVEGPHAWGRTTERIVGIPLGRFTWRWLALVGVALSVTMLLLVSIAWLLAYGVGLWGIQIPVAWGFAIVNFVWWIGIGHAGTLISAILLLLKQRWRTSINRFAEAMTLFAVAMAGLFPLLHLGRIWKFYYLFPYPNTLGLWPQWRSALVWDVIAILTYGTVSAIFWYLGLLPDLAALRDRARGRVAQLLAAFFSLGWRGSVRQWQRHQVVYLLMAGLLTPLVVSVHSIVSLDFSIAIVPGWHSTIFPPYFVAGAIFSGFAMLFTIAVPLRAAFGLKDLITARHLDAMCKVTLAAALVVDYGYVMEFFTAWYSADRFELYMAVNRALGAYWPAFALMMLGNVLAPQALWFRRVRRSPLLLWLLSIVFNVGMWVERYVIVVQSLHRDYMPSAWKTYHGTLWDWALFAGSLGAFALLMLLFVRFLPVVAAHEVNELVHEEGLAEHVEPETLPDHREDVPTEDVWGVAAEFSEPEAFVAAARQARHAGWTRLDGYTPWAVEDSGRALGLRRTRMPLAMLLGGLTGGALAYLMMWYSAVVGYPWNIGGRPLNSWPSFVPLTFELTVLSATLAGLVAMLIANRLPQPYHPMFHLPGFERATSDRFFLCLEAADPQFERAAAFAFLKSMGPVRVAEVRR